MLVSIIVPVYNPPLESFRRCLDSIVSQTHQDIEIILVDDGSHAPAADCCDEYKKKDSRVGVFHKKNGGASTARNLGIEKSQAEYIAFIDADDWVTHDYIETLLSNSIKYQADLTIADYTVTGTMDKPTTSSSSREIVPKVHVFNSEQEILLLQRKMLASNSYYPTTITGAPHCKLYRKNLFTENLLSFNPSLIHSQDSEFNFRVFNHVKIVVYIDRPIYVYFKHENSAVHSFNPKARQIHEAYIEQIALDIKATGKSEIFKKDFEDMLIERFIRILKLGIMHKKNTIKFSSQIDQINDMLSSEPFQTNFRQMSMSGLSYKRRLILLLAKIKASHAIYLAMTLFQMRNR